MPVDKLKIAYEDDVHVLVKGHELPDELAAVMQYQSHAVVNVLLHLTALGRLQILKQREEETDMKMRQVRTGGTRDVYAHPGPLLPQWEKSKTNGKREHTEIGANGATTGRRGKGRDSPPSTAFLTVPRCAHLLLCG